MLLEAILDALLQPEISCGQHSKLHPPFIFL